MFFFNVFSWWIGRCGHSSLVAVWMITGTTEWKVEINVGPYCLMSDDYILLSNCVLPEVKRFIFSTSPFSACMANANRNSEFWVFTENGWTPGLLWGHLHEQQCHQQTDQVYNYNRSKDGALGNSFRDTFRLLYFRLSVNLWQDNAHFYT